TAWHEVIEADHRGQARRMVRFAGPSLGRVRYMTRLISLGSRLASLRLGSLALGSLALAFVGTARAETQAEIAARLNEEGKQAMYADQPGEAAKKFQEAVARVPEAKYFINLCTARLQEGKLDEALTACDAVDLNNPTPDQKTKAAKLIE